MKITIYELLGMIKDGKAPKKIKYDNDVYGYIKKYGDYKCERTLLYLLDKIIRNDDYNMGIVLNDEVEIIEEEKKIPEKLLKDEFDELTKEAKLWKIFYKYNDLIDYLNSKGDE